MNFMGFGRDFDEAGYDDDDTKAREELILNIVVMVVSMFMIALVTIAVVANLDGGQQGAGTMLTLNSVCKRTDDAETCVRSLKRVGERATGLDYMKAAINATLYELVEVSMPKPEIEINLTPPQTESYKDCLALLDLGKEELYSLYTKMPNSNSPTGTSSMTVHDVQDILNSLSAVIAYQTACSNELMRTNSYEILGYSLKRPIQLARVTLAIVDNYFDKQTESEGKKRASDHDYRQLDGYASWFAGASEPKVKDFRKNGDGQQLKVDVIVALDGSGNFSTISEAFTACPNDGDDGPCVIYVKEGRYQERVLVPKFLGQVVMFGDGPTKTVVTGIDTEGPNIPATPIRQATFVVMGNGFTCSSMGFTAPPNLTGVPALLVISDHASFYKCKIDGEEGSLHALAQRQFYRDCEIHGNVNIILGDSATVIQNSQIIIKPRKSTDLVLKRNVVSAQSRSDKRERTGLVIQNCTIIAQGGTGDSLAATTYLGTPFNDQSRTIIMESWLGDVVNPEGWCKWRDQFGIDSATFREYMNRGPGAKVNNRVRWNSYRTVLKKDDMTSFLPVEFIQPDYWLPNTTLPYNSGFMFQHND